tara:strand:- start:11 stop:724 length:714 start_codon:yes stop_codon:yes gene_type:complete
MARSGFKMRSGNRSSFKNMGSSMAVNRSGYGNRPDGRAKSSPFETDKWKEVWDEETQTVKRVPIDGGTRTTTTTTQEGTATRENPAVTSFRERCYDDNGNRLVGKAGCKWDDSGDYKPPADETKPLSREDVKVTEEVNPEDDSSTKVKEEEKKGCAEKLGPEKYAARQAACAKRKSKWDEKSCNCGIRGGRVKRKTTKRRYNRPGTVASRFIKKTIKGVKKICTPDGNCWDDPGTSL